MTPAHLDGLQIAVPRPWVGADIDEDVAAAFENALARLRSAGATVQDIDAPDVGTSEHIGTAACFEIAEVHRSWYHEDPSRYGPEVRRRLADCYDRDPHLAPAAMQWRAGLRHAFERLFADHDVVVTPTTGLVAKTIGIDVVQLPSGPVHYRSLLSMFTAPVNQAGLPALSLPIAAPHGGVAGLQVIGKPWDEARLLGIGTAMEADPVGFRS
jgi:aspartyl-tRNA(Asn)/glutamyl-tRNA(Gln) amidotransferase subunit A